MGAIDKLDLRLPTEAVLTPPVVKVVQQLLRIRSKQPYRDRFYDCVVPLNFGGLRSTLHFQNRRNGSHKLELIGVGAMQLTAILGQIVGACELDPTNVEIMRIDLAVDITDFSVDWFRQNVRVKRKRYRSEFDRFRADYGRVETLYFGKRPNFIRIYDKREQLRVQQSQPRFNDRNEQTKRLRGAMCTTEITSPLTRIERQYGAGRVPHEIRTLARIQESARSFYPFDILQFLPFEISEDSLCELRGDVWLKALGLTKLIETHGYHHAKHLLDIKTNRNTSRLLKDFEVLANSSLTSRVPPLREAYQQMLAKQLEN